MLEESACRKLTILEVMEVAMIKRLLKKLIQSALGVVGVRLVRIKDSQHRGLRESLFRRIGAMFFSDQEKRQIVDRMDRGDFYFDEQTQKKLINQWHLAPSTVPLPTSVSKIYAEGDAIKANTIEMMESDYRLPYGLAYEDAQKAEYLSLIELCKSHGVEFDDSVVVDVGCGFGGLLNVVSEFYRPVKMYGIECASSAIEWISKHRLQITGIVANLESTSSNFSNLWGGGKGDVVFCTQVLEHLCYPERALKNLLTLKQKDGAVIITVPNGRVDTYCQHINFWSPESWKLFFKALETDYCVKIDRLPSLNAPGGFNLFVIVK